MKEVTRIEKRIYMGSIILIGSYLGYILIIKETSTRIETGWGYVGMGVVYLERVYGAWKMEDKKNFWIYSILGSIWIILACSYFINGVKYGNY